MTSRIALACAVGLAAAAACGPGEAQGGRFLDESAKADLDRADLVVVGRVQSLADDAPRRGTAGVRAIRVGLDVDAVLRGDAGQGSVCFTYYSPYGGFNGRPPKWVEMGMTGVFTLSRAGRCFRAVNDSRAVLRVYHDAGSAAASVEDRIAEMTLPVPQPNCSDVYSTVSELGSVTEPLVGSRAARALLARDRGEEAPDVSACACIAAALAWRVIEGCLNGLTNPDEAAKMADGIREENARLREADIDSLRQDSLGWLLHSIDAIGVDATLLRLGSALASSGGALRPVDCARAMESFNSGNFSQQVARARERFSAEAEAAATLQLRQWLASGCPADWERMERPASAP